MKISLNLFPGGKCKALTMSYDDGPMQDRRLVKIFNNHGIKGSFHLNSGLMGDNWRIFENEVADLYEGHEVSAHSVTHPRLEMLSNESLANEIREDRKALEELVGYPVRGMSLPFGTFNSSLLKALPALGIEYSRTVITHNGFDLPEDFIKWDATCHHNMDLINTGKRFLETKPWGAPMLMYVWGHSYEFDNDNNWNIIEEFCQLMGNRDDIWYATNIQIVDYINAQNNLKFSVDGKLVYNPSAISVWITADDKIVEVKGGSSLSI